MTSGLQLKTALQDIRSGDVLLADLHTTNAAEPWAMSNLEPLIRGLKERGLCFESLRKHPGLKDWIETHGG
jgi:peptidoglycan/xylan/chitin deacetylase (PgdA/CDA1 family)